jgi:hypothetical protein
MNKALCLAIIFFLATALFSRLYARNENNAENIKIKPEYKTFWYLSLDGGVTTLYGDNIKKFLDKQFNARLGAGYFFNSYLGADLRFGYGKLKGTYETSINNIYNIYNDISKVSYLEYNANAVLEPINLIFGYRPERKFTTQMHLGIGQIRTNASLNEKGILFQIPVGIMAGFQLAEYLYLYADYTYNWIDSGFIDNHNTDQSKDSFTTLNIGLNLKFEKLLNSNKKIKPTLYQSW